MKRAYFESKFSFAASAICALSLKNAAKSRLLRTPLSQRCLRPRSVCRPRPRFCRTLAQGLNFGAATSLRAQKKGGGSPRRWTARRMDRPDRHRSCSHKFLSLRFWRHETCEPFNARLLESFAGFSPRLAFHPSFRPWQRLNLWAPQARADTVKSRS